MIYIHKSFIGDFGFIYNFLIIWEMIEAFLPNGIQVEIGEGFDGDINSGLMECFLIDRFSV